MTNPPPPLRPSGSYEQSLTETRAARKALEARIAKARRRRRLGAIAAVLAVVGGGAGGAAWWLGRDTAPEVTPIAAGPTKKCATQTPVTLWSAPSMQPAAVALVKAFQADPSSPCVDYQVISRKPIEAMIGLGKGQPNRPDGWIPDSPLWVQKVNQAAGLNAKIATPFAESPLVVAMDPAEASKLDAQPAWLELVASDSPIRMSDPRSTTAGMLTLSTTLPLLSPEQGRVIIPKLAQQMAPSDDQLFATYTSEPAKASAFPTSEAALAEHNRVNAQKKMVAVIPAEGTPSFEYSLINVSTNPAKAQGIEALRAFLRSAEAAKTLASFGLRSTAVPVTLPTPPGSIGEIKPGATPPAAQVAAAIDVWQAATTSFQLLSVFDVSGSMNEKVGNTTRVKITQEAAGIALNALPRSTKLGLWVFSSDKGGTGRDYKELVPIGELSNDGHRARMATAATSLSKEVDGWTGLYDTIWAAYSKLKENYDPQRVNAVVILTDGKNEDPNGGLSLQQLLDRIKKATDPKKPIAITTIGIGPGVDADSLRKISRSSFSDFYGAENPADMTTVLARALFDHECKDGVCA
ncbi:substrate-binding and VWA domain-containing protein [Intrasporangium calvum]|uniref:Substrate-binding and VWA domain-containing protein n=1 Tax=Intrasporangium calvum TaxID=53358 RepID=A0ABT5GIS5_9MICO|nr:substrate-binding and VWA domain-containing protein [Intrasporangium calvum]MDC5697800.1 substrate-binding and VWA domain-containing protein [Intrasporangium calvum]